MRFEELREFLLQRMSMSHIYQPLVIRTLLENGGEASIRNIAHEFLAYDEAQVEYYIRIVKRWPKITLTKHNIINTELKGFFRLNLDFGSLMPEQKKELVDICNTKIREYINSYKGILGDYRYNPDDLSSSSVRYLVLKLAHGHCSLCGASIKDTPIDVDHIIPRNQGGSNDVSNLQALCYRCNRAKRDRDTTNFRNFESEQEDSSCIFCDLGKRVIQSYNSAQCIRDGFPVSDLHSLIIPKRHVSGINDLPLSEISDMFQLVKVVKNQLLQIDSSISGFNIGINEGTTGGQTIPHLHVHLIPRRYGDVPNPRGGIRGVIPGKASY
jgi:ATP adenylyltransferase